MQHYETIFILTPVLSEDQAKEVTGKFRKILEDSGAKIVHEESWGLKKLNAPMEKRSTGYYHLFEYHSGLNAVSDLEVAFRRDQRVLRFVTVRLDRHGNKPEDAPVI